MSQGFRSDIEGLRALAVLPILLFHLEAKWCPGGFIGVDIFFVISGYLITRMILAEGAGFSFGRFYARRFFRLFPALFATLLGTLAAAWSMIGPQEFVGLAKSAITAALGVSNVYFLETVDYFNASALDHPLLHTWSLGVEEQFYLVWPALLLLAIGRGRLSLLVLAVGALSLIGVFLVRPAQPEMVFYLMPFRIVEFAIGASVIAIEGAWSRASTAGNSLLGIAAVVAIAVCLAAFDGQTPWPGLLTLIPCAATAALILAGRDGIWKVVLSAAPLRFLGRISYSLYLVHWPLIALYRHRIVVEPSLGELLFLGAGAIVLGWALFTLVETPFRAGGAGVSAADGMTAAYETPRNRIAALLSGRWVMPRPLSLAAVALTGLGVLAASSAVIASGGFAGRLDKSRVQFLDKGLSFAGDQCGFKRSRCQFGDREAQQTVYLIGDSHALNLVHGLDQLFKQARIKGIALYDHGCPFVPGTLLFAAGVVDQKCKKNVVEAYAHLASNRHPLILVGSYAGYRGSLGAEGETAPKRLEDDAYYLWLGERMKSGLAMLNAGQRPVIILKSSYVTGVHLPKCLSQPGLGDDEQEREKKCAAWPLAQVQARFQGVDRMIDDVARGVAGATVIDPKMLFCSSARCVTQGDNGLYFRDIEHLTNAGSVFLIERMKPELLAAIGAR